MRSLLLALLLVMLVGLSGQALAAPPAPHMNYDASGLDVTVSWTAVSGATGYRLCFAPHPFTGVETIGSIDLGMRTSISETLWAGAAYYIAIRAYDAQGQSEYSNVGLFVLPANPNDYDGDGDGYAEWQGDCNDDNTQIKPDATEICGNGQDDDCDGLTDEGCTGGAFTDPTTGMQFVQVPGGCFQMGDPFTIGFFDEKPVHEVCVNSFYIGKYEVTQGEWQAVAGSNPSFFKTGDRYPVEMVNWDDIQTYIASLNQRSGKNFRLPTEAEWEIAARSGGKVETWAGTSSESSLDNYAWYGNNSGNTTHPVGGKQANGLGLFDMSGNVSEWVSDRYDRSYYSVSPRQNPQGPTTNFRRVIRGGSCIDSLSRIRASSRDSAGPALRDIYLGFRLVLPSVQ